METNSNTTPGYNQSATHAAGRLASIDIYRGIVMFLMLAEVLHLANLRKIFPGDNWIGTLCEWLKYHTTHVEWTGCSLHDMIQPSFTFLVGTSMAFSLVARAAKGQSTSMMLLHALGRSAILVFLGIFLRSLSGNKVNYTFDDTLTQIGLGYWILFLLSCLSVRGLAASLAVVLLGYWLAFVLYPVPPADFDYPKYGVPADWPEHWKEGLAVHFNKNSNLAWSFDTWWMNLFPRQQEFTHSEGGYSTLSFVPTLGTMIIGLIAGRILQQPKPWSVRFWQLVLLGIGSLAVAWVVHATQVCPIVKRIWTPSWTLWSGGVCCLWLAGLSFLCDFLGWVKWGFPWIVVGANSIVAYVMSWTLENSTGREIRRYLGWILDWFSTKIVAWTGIPPEQKDALEKLMVGGLTLGVFWLILYWMYRRKIFVRI